MACLNAPDRQRAAPAGGFALGGCRPASTGRRWRWRRCRHGGAFVPDPSHACACEGPPEEALPRRAASILRLPAAHCAGRTMFALHEALVYISCCRAHISLGVGGKTVAQVPEGKSSRPFATPACHVLDRSGEGGQRAAAHDPAAGGDGQAVPAPAGGARLDGAQGRPQPNPI